MSVCVFVCIEFYSGPRFFRIIMIIVDIPTGCSTAAAATAAIATTTTAIANVFWNRERENEEEEEWNINKKSVTFAEGNQFEMNRSILPRQ